MKEYIFKLYLWSPSFGCEVAKEPVKPTPTTGEPISQTNGCHIKSQIASKCSYFWLQIPPSKPQFGNRVHRNFKFFTFCKGHHTAKRINLLQCSFMVESDQIWINYKTLEEMSLKYETSVFLSQSVPILVYKCERKYIFVCLQSIHTESESELVITW